MFGRKKKEDSEAKLDTNFKEWDKDLGFLNLILSRKKGITKEFLIGIFNRQQRDKDYLKDEDIDPIVFNIVSETMASLSPTYKEFLITKYFGSEENLIKFITEDVYVDLVSDAINRNTTRIRENLQKNIIKRISTLNAGSSQKTTTPKTTKKK